MAKIKQRHRDAAIKACNDYTKIPKLDDIAQAIADTEERANKNIDIRISKLKSKFSDENKILRAEVNQLTDELSKQSVKMAKLIKDVEDERDVAQAKVEKLREENEALRKRFHKKGE